MTDWWDKQILRADQLVAHAKGSEELLVFYSRLLGEQKEIYEFLQSRKDWLPSGELQADLAVITEALPRFLKAIASYGPELLAAEATELLTASTGIADELFLNYW